MIETRDLTHEEQVTTFKRAIDMVRDAGLILIDAGLFLASDVVAGTMFTLRKQYELFSDAALPGESDPHSDLRPGAATADSNGTTFPTSTAAAVIAGRSAQAFPAGIDLRCYGCRSEYRPVDLADALRFLRDHAH